jgi:hypothetical protein
LIYKITYCARAQYNIKVHRTACFLAGPVNRLVGRVVLFAISINERRALLTASSFGNALATSGLRTMTLDDSFRRFVYLPRTKAAGKSRTRILGA